MSPLLLKLIILALSVTFNGDEAECEQFAKLIEPYVYEKIVSDHEVQEILDEFKTPNNIH